MSNRTPQRKPNAGRSQNRQNPPNRKKPQASKSQVPVKKKPQKKKLTKKQIEERKNYLKKKRAEARKIFFNRFRMFLVIFVVLLAFSVGIFALNLFMHTNTTSARYTYQLGEDKTTGTISRRVSYESLFVNNQVYINMSELAALYEMIITGDSDSIRFILPDETGEVVNDVKFMLKTSLAYVNGVPVRMSGGVDIRGSEIYVPMKFFNDYVSGVTVTYSKSDLKLIIKLTSPEQTEIWFNLRSGEETENIPEMSLDYEILYLTDPERLAAEARKAKEAEKLAGENAE